MSTTPTANGRHRTLDEDDADEIRRRAERMRVIREAAAAREGQAPDAVRLAAADLDAIDGAPVPTLRSGERKLLAEVARHYQPGDVVRSSELAAKLGRPPAADAMAPAARRPPPPRRPVPDPDPDPEPTPELRIPDPDVIRNGDPKADAELLACQRILQQLSRLPTSRARRRVLAMLLDRVEEEGGPP